MGKNERVRNGTFPLDECRGAETQSAAANGFRERKTERYASINLRFIITHSFEILLRNPMPLGAIKSALNLTTSLLSLSTDIETSTITRKALVRVERKHQFILPSIFLHPFVNIKGAAFVGEIAKTKHLQPKTVLSQFLFSGGRRRDKLESEYEMHF